MHNSLYDNGLDIIPNSASNYLHDYDVLVRTPYTNNLFGIGAGGLVTNCDDLQNMIYTEKIIGEHTANPSMPECTT